MFSSRAGLFFYDLQLQQLIQLPKVQHSALAGNSFNETEAAKAYDITFVGQRYYIGTNDGVFSFSEQHLIDFVQGKLTEIPYQVALENISVWQLLTLKNIIYVATTDGLYRVDSDNQQSEYLFKFGQYFKSVADGRGKSALD